MTKPTIGLFCFKCGQSRDSKLHTEARLGAHKFVESVSAEHLNVAKDAHDEKEAGRTPAEKIELECICGKPAMGTCAMCAKEEKAEDLAIALLCKKCAMACKSAVLSLT